MDKRIYAFNNENERQGYARIGKDETGKVLGEVYDTEANKIGAVRFEPLDMHGKLGLVYNHEGAQIGYIRLEAYEGDRFSADVYMLAQPNTTDRVVPTLRKEPLLKQEVDERSRVTPEQEEIDDEIVAYLSYGPDNQEQVEVREESEDGQILGWLESEDVEETDRLILIGGGAALLLLV